MRTPQEERHFIFDEIVGERGLQDAQWGGATHDDSHERFEWCTYIEKQSGLARSVADSSIDAFEYRMVKVAALALAAIESSRRQRI